MAQRYEEELRFPQSELQKRKDLTTPSLTRILRSQGSFSPFSEVWTHVVAHSVGAFPNFRQVAKRFVSADRARLKNGICKGMNSRRRSRMGASITVRYDNIEPSDKAVLEKFEMVIKKAMPVHFGRMWNVIWKRDLKSQTGRYFDLLIEKKEELGPIDSWKLSELEPMTEQDFEQKLVHAAFTKKAFKPKEVRGINSSSSPKP
jgi:hypothetical protein